MDLPLSQAVRPLQEDAMAKLTRLAEALGCSTDVFFDPVSVASEADTAKILQMWSSVTNAAGRQSIYRFIQMVLDVQTL